PPPPADVGTARRGERTPSVRRRVVRRPGSSIRAARGGAVARQQGRRSPLPGGRGAGAPPRPAAGRAPVRALRRIPRVRLRASDRARRPPRRERPGRPRGRASDRCAGGRGSLPGGPRSGRGGGARGGPVSEVLLQGSGGHKSYGGVRALRGVDFELHAGEIHALVGENGSGKSTLLGILSGQLAPDAGTVLLGGDPVRFGDAAVAMQAGIATVTQETTLVPHLSVAENIFLGPRKPRHWYGIDWRSTRARAKQIIDRLELAIEPDDRVGDLRPDQQQMVEIARALSMDARVVIL